MRYLKKYNEINEGWFSKKKKAPKMSKKEFFYYILDNYKNLEFLSADESNRIYHIGGHVGKNIDFFSVVKSKKEVMGEIGSGEPLITFSDEEYEKVSKKIEEIIEYLDEKENISDTSADDILNMNPKEDTDIALMKLNKEVSKEFKDYLNVPLKFDTQYHLWSSDSENEEKYSEISLVFKSIEPSYPFFNTIDLYCELDGKDMYIQFSKGVETDYFDLKEWGPGDRRMPLILRDDESKLTRKEKRYKDNNIKYPHIGNYYIVPSEWKSIEFFKLLKSFLESLSELQK